MKKIAFLGSLLTLSLVNVAWGQTVAVTEYGDTVYLYADGSWTYDLLDDYEDEMDALFGKPLTVQDTVDTPYTAPSNTNKQVENSFDMFEVRYNGNAWSRVPAGTLNGDAEFAWESKRTDLYSVVISEETPIAQDYLFTIARDNMKEATANPVEVLTLEAVTVNDVPMLHGVMRAQVTGVDFVFEGYYYSDDRGSVQFITWTSERIWESNRKHIRDMLNGFVVMPE